MMFKNVCDGSKICVMWLENACGGSGMCNGSQQWALVSKMGTRC